MPDEHPTTDRLIVEYIGRGPASLSNVASHFGMPLKDAHDTLVRLEDDGHIQPVGRISWRVADAR